MTLNEVMADVKHEGDLDPFKDLDKPEADKETETPSDSPTEKEVKVEEPVQGDNTEVKREIPFHEHPRWREREEELKQLRAFREEVTPKLSMLEQKLQAQATTDENIPEWFKELYGENAVAWQKYSERSKLEREEIKKEIVAEQEAKHLEAQKEEQYWNNWVEEGIKGLQTVGLEFDRNALIKVMLENSQAVTNALGNFDFNLGYKLYKVKYPDNSQANSQARKKLADTATKSSRTDKDSKDYMTSNELRNKTWNQL